MLRELPDTVGKISLQVLLPLLIFTFGPVSGAHFNPMVTAASVATKAMVSCCTPCLSKSAMLAATLLLAHPRVRTPKTGRQRLTVG